MFETFNCPCMYLSNQSVLSAYSIGKSTGCVIDCGDGSTNFSPIFEGLLCRNVLLIFLLQERKFLKIYINYFQ
jgi:actin-related protein